MKRLIIPLAFAFLASPFAAQAQDSGVELSLFAGYRSGDGFNVFDAFDDFLETRLQVEDGDVFGGVLGIPLTDHLLLEFLYSQQNTQLSERGGLFEPDLEISDLDVTYIHGGVAYQWTPGQLRPFVDVGLGAAILDPASSSLDRETRLSGHFGGGIKVFLNDFFGIRVEGRALWADLNDQASHDSRRDHHRNTDDLFQGEASAGIIFRF